MSSAILGMLVATRTRSPLCATYEVGVLAGILETDDSRVHAVKVRANSDVLLATDLGNVLDVVGDALDGGVVGVDKLGVKDGHDDAVHLVGTIADHGEDIVGDIARVVENGPGSRVGKHDRCTCGPDSVPHGLGGRVRQVDEDTQAVHLFDQGIAKVGQAVTRVHTLEGSTTARRRSKHWAGQRVHHWRLTIVTSVGEGDIAYTQLSIQPHNGQAVTELMATVSSADFSLTRETRPSTPMRVPIFPSLAALTMSAELETSAKS